MKVGCYFRWNDIVLEALSRAGGEARRDRSGNNHWGQKLAGSTATEPILRRSTFSMKDKVTCSYTVLWFADYRYWYRYFSTFLG